VLKPGGLLIVANFVYLANHSPVAEDTEKLILKYNPNWAFAGMDGNAPVWQMS